jgi:hypothetical protein
VGKKKMKVLSFVLHTVETVLAEEEQEEEGILLRPVYYSCKRQ